MKKHNSILSATIFVSLLIILGKILGFFREMIIAAYYGATALTDAFFFAQGMPAMIFPAVCNSLSTAFISLYVKRLAENGEQEGDRYASRMLATTTILGVILSVAGVLLAPVLVPLLAPGFAGEQLNLAIHLTRLTMGAFVLTMLQYMLCAILNSKKLFIGSQVAGLLYNAVIVAITVVLGRGQSMDTLTLTVVAGMAIQVLALMFCCRGQFTFCFGLSPIHRDSGILLRLALPILLGNSVVQLNNIVDKALCSMLPAGSLSALSYANTLNTLVISVFISSLSTVLYPTLTADAASGNMDRYGKTLMQSMTNLTMLLIPISCITFLDAEEIIRIIYARGDFSEEAVVVTALVLSCYAPRFVFAGFREVLTRAFFALQDTKTPMIAGSIGVGCNIVFSLLFVRWLGVAGIALGTVVSVFVIAVLLLWWTHKKLPMLPVKNLIFRLGKQMAASGVLIIALMAFRSFVDIPWPLIRFATDTAVGFAVYLLALWMMGAEEVNTVLRVLKRKMCKDK